MEYCTSQEAWETHVTAIMTVEPEQLPPVILEYRGRAPLGLHDGSHRHEAMCRRGAASIWALIWCNTESDFLAATPVYGGFLAPRLTNAEADEGSIELFAAQPQTLI